MSAEEREQRREHGRKIAATVLHSPEVRAKTLAADVRLRAGASRSATALSWCPAEWRDTYREIKSKGRKAAEAKAIVLDLIAGKPAPTPYLKQRTVQTWCPDRLRPLYDRLRETEGPREAKRAVLEEIESERRRFLDPSAAADYLRRYAPVYRCTANGRQQIGGTHWRCGTRTLDRDGITKQALAKGWTPDAWRRVAA